MGKSKNTSVEKTDKSKQGSGKNPEIADKRKHFAKIYMQFSRLKYQQYKLQFVKLRQSEIVDKIVKQWEALSEDDKLKLQKQFKQIGGQEFLKDSSKSKSGSGSGSIVKVGEENIEGADPTKPKKKKKTSPKVRVFVEKATDKNRNYMEESDFRKEENAIEKKQVSDNDSIQITVKKQRKIKKVAKRQSEKKESKKISDYLQFFKYYFNRLEVEHPRWSNAQISTIIKLLWRKRTSTANKKQKDRISTGKAVSGRVMFRKVKQASGLTKQQIIGIWRLLPRESKKYWEILGKGRSYFRKSSLSEEMSKLKKVMKQGSDKQIKTNSLKWMESQVKAA